MKKRKIYEISVIDKTYSKIISDETKFYTSDTALELGFELKETEYTFESAEIVLLNIDDRSSVTRPVTKSLDSFTYELDDDIIAHYGDWLGQLRFEAGEIYVSSPVRFRIENDLSNDRPPQLSDVQSWVSLKRYADSLTEELRQAVLSVEGMDDTFNANEAVRQSQFDSAEQSRQATFEANESERNETFKSNEITRQAQEIEREKAEIHRQSVFDDNEVSRTEIFNANEATRQANETSRQQAESQRQSTFETNETERQTTFETAEQERQSAELIRFENEKQRNLTSVDEFIKLQDSTGGRNYFKNSNVEVAGRAEFVNSLAWDMSPIIDEFGTDIYYTVSFDIKSKVAGNINVYAQNGSGTKYSIGRKGINVSTEYQRFSYTFKPFISITTEARSILAFYGGSETGRIPTVKNVKFEVRDNPTPYTKAPEDYEVVSKIDYYNHVKLMNDFKDSQFNQLKQAVIALGGAV